MKLMHKELMMLDTAEDENKSKDADQQSVVSASVVQLQSQSLHPTARHSQGYSSR